MLDSDQHPRLHQRSGPKRSVENPPSAIVNEDLATQPQNQEENVNETLQDAGMEPITYYPPDQSGTGTADDAGLSSGPTPDEVEDDEPSVEERRYPRRESRKPDYLSPGHAQFTGVADMAEPSTVAEAQAISDADRWTAALDSELSSLEKHDTCDIVTLPKGIRPLSTKMVFKRKLNEDGTVSRYKARLVVRGFMQGNVEETYAPVVYFTTVRAALAVALLKGYGVHQMDVKTAFLRGELDSDVYTTPPIGVQLCGPGEVLKLKKGLYGLKQAQTLWNKKWVDVMTHLKFTSLLSDACAFRRGNSWILLYVDDIIIIGEHNYIHAIKKELSTHLDVKDLGMLRQFESDVSQR